MDKKPPIISARTHRISAQKALLDMFSSATKLPIGLYEIQDGEIREIFSKRSLANFEDHCQFLHQFPGGKKLCQQDQCNRANVAISSQDEQLTLCHAGLYNQAVPIKVNGETRAVLLYGEMQIEGAEYHQESIKQHQSAVKKLG